MSKYIKVTDVELGGSIKIGDIELSNTDLADLIGEDGASTANAVSVVSSGFTGNLSTDIETVQDALEELDALELGSGGGEDMLIQNYAPTDATIELSPDTNIYTITVSSATTFVFDTTALNLAAGQACTFELDLTMSTVSTLTFPASVSWVYGTPYMGDAGKIYRLVFHSMDQGASWHANLAFKRSV